MVCLNTMGQDREFTEEERKFALRTVREFAAQWEAVEKKNLEADIEQRLEQIPKDREYKENYENIDQTELEKAIDEALKPKEGEEPLDEDTYNLQAKKLRLEKLTHQFVSPARDLKKKKEFVVHDDKPLTPSADPNAPAEN